MRFESACFLVTTCLVDGGVFEIAIGGESAMVHTAQETSFGVKQLGTA